MHIQLAESLEAALKIFTETIPYEEIFEIKYRGLRVLDGKPSKEVNIAWSYYHTSLIYFLFIIIVH